MYAEVAEFRRMFPRKSISDEEIKDSVSLACIKADELTFGRITAMWGKLTPFQLQKVKEFVCRQALYIHENGYDDSLNSDVSSYSAGSISVSVTEKNKTQADLMCVDPAALACLKQSGLMWRGA